MSNGGIITHESFIDQLLGKHPDWKQKVVSGEWSREKVYGMGRSKYPNAPVEDWAAGGHIPRSQRGAVGDSSKYDDPMDKYRNAISEDNFLDYLDWGLGDEDDWFVTRLAYERSLQGLIDAELRGKARFDFDRQPKLLSLIHI